MSTFAVYLRLVRLQIRSQFEYRTSFFLSLASTFLFTTLEFAAILIIFSNVDALAGWSAIEVFLLYAAASISFALTDMVTGSLDQLPNLIRQGTFDTLVVRPRSTFFQLLATDFMFRRVGRLLQAAVVLAVVVVLLDVEWTPARVAVLSGAVLAGAVIMGALWVIASTIAFWVVEAGEFVNAFTTGSWFLSQYPLDIYAGWLRRLVLFVLPIGFVIYMPASYVLGKEDTLGLPEWMRFMSPVAAVVMVVVAAGLWKVALRRYRGAGG